MSMEPESSLDSANEYFKQLGKVTRAVDREENARLWVLAKKGDEKAKNKILENNLRLVIPTAKRFLRPGMDLMDLIEEGNLGLLQAIAKFEPKKGYRFSTYAIYWIEQYIRRYIEEQSGSIKIPSHAWGNLKRWFRAWNELKEANGREPSLNEMAQELNLTARQVKSIIDTLNAAKGVDSLTTLVYAAEDEMTLEDLISDDGKGNPHEVFLERENQQSIKQSMSDLDDRDRQVVIMRYGLDDNEPKTLGEVADALGLSRERVRQIEERAVRALRREALRMGLLEIKEGDFRTRKLHSAMRGRVKTNILGEEKPQGFWGRLLSQTKKSLQIKPARAAKTTSKKIRKKKAAAPKHVRAKSKKVAVVTRKKNSAARKPVAKKRPAARSKKAVRRTTRKPTRKKSSKK